MELFEVYDVTKSYVQRANLCGVDPKIRKAMSPKRSSQSGPRGSDCPDGLAGDWGDFYLFEPPTYLFGRGF